MKSLFNRAKSIISYEIEEFNDEATPGKNYVNKLQACCAQKNLAIATEKGNVYIYNVRKNEIN